MKAIRPVILLAADGEGAALPAEAPPAAKAAEATPPPAAPPPAGKTEEPGKAPPAAAPYLPDGLPDDVKGASDRETIDKLAARMKGLRDEMAKRGAVPKEPKDYKIEWAGDLKGQAAALDKDPAVADFRTFGHKHGLTDKQVNGLLNDYLSHQLAQGRMAQVIDPDAEARKLLGDKAAGRTTAEVREAATQRFSQATDWIAGLERQKVIKPAAALRLRALAEDADGVELIEALKGIEAKSRGPSPGGKGADDEPVTRASLRERLADPRYDPNSPKYDPAFRRQTEELYRKHV